MFLENPASSFLKPRRASPIRERTTKGLVLTRQWTDTGNGQHLIFWLATDEGPLRLEYANQESVFFLARSDLKRATKLLDPKINWRHAAVALKCFGQQDELAVACYFRNQRDLGFARTTLSQNGITAFEADIRPTDRFLMERFIKGTVEVAGEQIEGPGAPCMFEPRLRAADYQPTLSVVSLDIETSVSKGHIISIAVQSASDRQVFMLADPGESSAISWLEFVPDEKTLIERFLDWFSQLDPDVIIGWSVVAFDLRYIAERCDHLGVLFSLGRDGLPVSWREATRGQQRLFAMVPGRVVLDGIELLRTATYSFESFSLENVSRELLGRGKLIHDVDARASEIEVLHAQDKDALARYNLEDCALVLDIFQHTNLTEFAVSRSCLTGLEMDRPGGSVAAFDFLYLPKLHRAGYVAPVVDENNIVHSPGGYVLDSLPGLYKHVIVLDFKSLYPSIIRSFHVDPLAMIAPDEERIEGFLEASFSKNHCILPRIIEGLWQARDEAKQAQDAAGSQAIKIIMNSFYGVLGTPGCRFFDPRLASSITLRGHQILQKTRDLIEAQGYPVIYGDTDSVFVLMDRPSLDVAAAGSELAAYLNQWWQDELRETYGAHSHLEIEFETHFQRFFMPTVRGSVVGSKKRYAGLVYEEGEPRLIFKGLESVRSDWSPLAREFQQELFRRVFFDEPVEDYIADTVRQVLDAELDHKLTLRRRLRRKLDDYVKNVPPHVRAARLADARRIEKGLEPAYRHGGWIEYRMTINGPEPTAFSESIVDYDFYIERQLAPIADAVLVFRQTTLAELIDRQLGLFE